MAGPTRPQDRVLLSDMKENFNTNLVGMVANRNLAKDTMPRFEGEGGTTAVGHEASIHASSAVSMNGHDFALKDGAVVIAAITSCTNTSNPAVMLAAGLLARNAVAKGLKTAPWVKTSLAPGSLVVTDYLAKAGLIDDMEKLGFFVVGYGCTTCIGNSGPLPEEVSKGIAESDLVVAAVLSGNRNFEGRVHPEVKMNYLASPPLVVAYALAGTVNIDLSTQALGTGSGGEAVYLRDIWPSNKEIGDLIARSVGPEMFKKNYANVFAGDSRWNQIESPDGAAFEWDEASTYIKNPPYFDGMQMAVGTIDDIHGARVLGIFGNSITTDHISPAGSIQEDGPAGKWLKANGVLKADFNSYGSRRGNHEIMMRGTFANVRIKNRMIPAKDDGSAVEGGITQFQPTGEEMSIYDAAMRYVAAGTPTMVFGGEEYGTGSSRDWAAKGTQLLGVKAVITRSFERIHRSNLVGMGVLPLQFIGNDSVDTLGILGNETFDLKGLEGEIKPQQQATLVIHRADGSTKEVQLLLRIDTPIEVDYYKHGGILPFVLRQLLAA